MKQYDVILISKFTAIKNGDYKLVCIDEFETLYTSLETPIGWPNFKIVDFPSQVND